MSLSTLIIVIIYLHVATHTVTTQPAGCNELRTIIRDCSCESTVDSTDDIVINCRQRGLKSMPLINGTYSGLIYEFTLAKNDIEELPEEAFKGLRIQRLDVTENKLTNISDTAFLGQEATLIVLKIGGDITSSVSAPFTAISNLTNLQELELLNFYVPNNNLEDRNHFLPFTNLLKLTLDNWGLQSIGSDAFLGLRSLKELTLSKHGPLTTYPVQAVNQMAETIEQITITDTGLTKLQFYGFQVLQVLKRLNLRSNNINFLEEECFKGLENKLEYLDLSFNGIPASNLSRIQTLEGLQFLLLQNVGLVNLPQNAVFLLKKHNLKELDLSRNHLTSIPSNAFQNLTMLMLLELSQNKIATMADDSLNGLTSLKTLHLDSQTGTPLTLPTLTALTSLTQLVLDYTNLSSDSWDKISQVQSLTSLKMKKTGLRTIPAQVFRLMTNLAELDLSDNKIQNITQETFVGPKDSLKKIYLTNNIIATFDKCTFYNYSSSLQIDLINNPLRCDCSLYWLSVAIKLGEIGFVDNIETCSYPANLNGQFFTSLDPSAFCNSVPSSPQCLNYYSTTTTSPTTTTTLPPVTINVVATSISTNSITITWTLDLPQYITYIIVVHTDLSMEQQNDSRQLSPTLSEYTVSKLKSDTTYQICVDGHRVDDKLPNSECVTHSTKKSSSGTSTTTDPITDSQTSNNIEIGIIIGSVVGGLLLFGILVAIIYLMFIRKKAPKETYPVQPRTFTRAELPTVGYDSKRYRKKKKDTTDGNKNDVSVTVISDGKTAPNIGRVSAGSYQYLQDNQPVNTQPNTSPPYVNDAAVKQASSPYENDMNLRALPDMPKESAGYYNPPFKNTATDDKQSHEYSEINL